MKFNSPYYIKKTRMIPGFMPDSFVDTEFILLCNKLYSKISQRLVLKLKS